MEKNINMCNAVFSYGIEKEFNVIWLEDLNGEKSLTNDIEFAINKITFENDLFLSDLINYKIMYKDSTGIWDGVKLKLTVNEFMGNEFSLIDDVSFFPISETDYELALYKLLATKNI